MKSLVGERRQAEETLPIKLAPSNLIQRKCACGGKKGMGEQCAGCASKGLSLERSPLSLNEPMQAPPIVAEVLRSPGQPLDQAARAFFEPRFGHDFGRVRVHTDGKAAESASAVSALAYTVGHDVVFGQGKYALGTTEGRQLLAHELTHVVQQSAVSSEPTNLTLGDANDDYEREAEAAKDRLLHQRVDGGASAPVVQRAPRPAMMRSQLFSSTLKICHAELKSRDFKVSQGGLKVGIDARWEGPDEGAASCASFRPKPYSVFLSQKGWIFDSEFGTCDFDPERLSSRAWTSLPPDDYYLTIFTGNTNPNCCLEGSIEVSEEAGLTGESCTKLPDDALTILHTALDIAGLVPFLGAVPDAINAGIYIIQGDWVSAGISAAAMIPIFGEGVIVTKLGVKVTRSAVKRVGKESLEIALKEARTLEKEVGKQVVKNSLEIAARYAREGTIVTYKEGKKITEGLNHAYEAHHILEARFLRAWGLNSSEAPAVILARKDHQALTKKLQEELPYGKTYTVGAVWKEYKKVYADFPNYLEAIKPYFKAIEP